MRLALAARFARRELRGGLRGFRVFLACLAIGVAAVAAVGSVRSAIEAGIDREGRALLGGDAELKLTYRFASGEERAWMDSVAEAVSEVVDFRSMATADSALTGETERGLTQVKAIDAAWPLYGAAEFAPDAPIADILGERHGRWGVAMAPALIDRMGLEIGQIVRLGVGEYELRAALEAEPDGVSGGFGLGPRTLIRTEALETSGLLAPGTLYETEYRLRLAETADLDALKAASEEVFPESGARWRDRRNGAPGVERFVDRLAAFLVLVGLAALAVGGVGVSSAVRAYMEAKTETIATLKTLGASGSDIFAIYLMQIGALAALGVGIGLAVGAGGPALLGPLFEDLLPVPALFDVYAGPVAEAATYGVLTALLFALWPLARARDVRAAGLFRDLVGGTGAWPRPVFLVAIGVIAAALIGSAVAFSGAPKLALGVVGGVAAALATLWLMARLVGRAARALARSRFARGKPGLRLALAAVGGPGGETGGAMLSLGLGLTVLAAIGQIDVNMRAVLDDELPDRAPAFFFVDVQDHQIDAFRAQARADPGVEELNSAPMLRGVITALRGVPAAEAEIDPAGAWALRGDRGVSYSAAPPPGTVLTEGEWWPEDYNGPPLVSFSDEIGRELGLSLGDEVTVNILGRDVTATVASFRVVDFSTMGINFLMVLDPGALRGAPHTHIATVYAEEAAEGRLMRELAGAFPNVTAIRVRDAIDRVSDALGDLAAATRWGAAATLLTGLVVLIGAAAAGERRRTYEAAILKTLGAARGRILASFAIRAGIVGASAGLVAIAFGAAAAWGAMTFAMEADYAFAPLPAVLVVAGGAAASLLAGLAFAAKSLAARPAQVLRSRD